MYLNRFKYSSIKVNYYELILINYILLGEATVSIALNMSLSLTSFIKNETHIDKIFI